MSIQQIDVSFPYVCPPIEDKLHHNTVKVAVEPRAAGEWFGSHPDKAMTQSIINKMTDA